MMLANILDPPLFITYLSHWYEQLQISEIAAEEGLRSARHNLKTEVSM
jgi:hypothetical protein